MATTPATLNGISKYATDLQSILTRAVAIARLPVTALQNRDADVLQKQTQLSTLGASVGDLEIRLRRLERDSGFEHRNAEFDCRRHELPDPSHSGEQQSGGAPGCYQCQRLGCDSYRID